MRADFTTYMRGSQSGNERLTQPEQEPFSLNYQPKDVSTTFYPCNKPLESANMLEQYVPNFSYINVKINLYPSNLPFKWVVFLSFVFAILIHHRSLFAFLS